MAYIDTSQKDTYKWTKMIWDKTKIPNLTNFREMQIKTKKSSHPH